MYAKSVHGSATQGPEEVCPGQVVILVGLSLFFPSKEREEVETSRDGASEIATSCRKDEKVGPLSRTRNCP